MQEIHMDGGINGEPSRSPDRTADALERIATALEYIANAVSSEYLDELPFPDLPERIFYVSGPRVAS